MVCPLLQPIWQEQVSCAGEQLPQILARFGYIHIHGQGSGPLRREGLQEELVESAEPQSSCRRLSWKEAGEKRPQGGKLWKTVDTPDAALDETQRIRIDVPVPEAYGPIVAGTWP